MCRALLDASVIMRLGGLVYLRPDDVAELVVQVRFAYRSVLDGLRDLEPEGTVMPVTRRWGSASSK